MFILNYTLIPLSQELTRTINVDFKKMHPLTMTGPYSLMASTFTTDVIVSPPHYMAFTLEAHA